MCDRKQHMMNDVIAALRLSRELDARAQELRRRAGRAMAGMNARDIARIAEQSGYTAGTLFMLANNPAARNGQ